MLACSPDTLKNMHCSGCGRKAHGYVVASLEFEYLCLGIAVLAGAGGQVVRFDDHSPLTYGKDGFANPFFIAFAPTVALQKA